MGFEIYLSSKTDKFLRNIDKKTYESLVKKIKNLAEDPFPSEAKKVVGRKEKVFRLRVGKYRILYVVYLELGTVVIADIDKRSRVYR